MIELKKYREMDCPVCGKFYFSELDETDVEMYDYIQCTSCGWKCDADQVDDPDSKHGLNELSLNEFKAQYEKKIAERPDYHYQNDNYDAEAHVCPICGKYEFFEINSFEVCPFCGWQDDSVMEADPDDWAGCSNDLSLNDFKRRYEEKIKENSKYKYSKDGI